MEVAGAAIGVTSGHGIQGAAGTGAGQAFGGRGLAAGSLQGRGQRLTLEQAFQQPRGASCPGHRVIIVIGHPYGCLHLLHQVLVATITRHQGRQF